MAEQNESAGKQNAYSLQDIFDALASGLRFQELLDRILTIALRELRADEGSLLLLQGADDPQLKMIAAIGVPEAIVARGYVPRKGSISEYVIRERRPVVVNDDTHNEQYQSMDPPMNLRPGIHSALCVPLVTRGKLVGTMNLNRTKTLVRFTDNEVEACSIIANQAALVVQNRLLQEELRQQERLAAVGQTVVGISHCVKNMLASVRGGLSLTEMGFKENRTDLAKEGFAMLKRNVATLSNLVLDLLDYSKEREPVREDFPVAPLLRAVEDAMRFKADAAGVTLEYACLQKDLSYFGDRDRIYRVLLNLVTNAIEASADGGSEGAEPAVSVTAAPVTPGDTGLPANRALKAGEWLAIDVVDNGMGISEHQQPLVWDLFYSTKGGRGTGIGLATSKKLIEEHGGDILLKSAPGRGAQFRVLLPMPVQF